MRRLEARPLASLVAAGACALALFSAAAAEPEFDRGDDKLRNVEDAIAAEEERLKSLDLQAQDLDSEIGRLQQGLVGYAAEVQRREMELAKVDRDVQALEATRSSKLAALADQRSDLGALLAALQRLSLQPREALILGYQSPRDMVLSAELLNYALPGMQEKAARLKRELDDIQRLKDDADRQRGEIAVATASLRSVREGIKRLVDQKAGMRRTTEEERAAVALRMKELADQAQDLRDLLAALPATPTPPEIGPEEGTTATAPAILRLEPPQDLKAFPRKRDGVVPPVAGNIVASFGQVTEEGTHSQGIVIETLPGAQVVAPHDGQAVFRGPFRSYGELLIIEHRNGYHTLLAGLGRTDVVVGQWVLAGEPVGVMDVLESGRPRLYVEFRRYGNPVDPWPWLEARMNKVE
ncbi:MAG TPA: peptidoglycan DD-metalloendopeptidase family protein [Dongiaceae bacterium]